MTRPLHLLPLLELFGREDAFHLLGLRLAVCAHLLGLRLHLLYILQVDLIELLRLLFAEVQLLGHAFGPALGHLLGRRPLLHHRSLLRILRKSARSGQQAQSRGDCKNSLFHNLKYQWLIQSVNRTRFGPLTMQR